MNTYKACRVTFNGERFYIHANGQAFQLNEGDKRTFGELAAWAMTSEAHPIEDAWRRQVIEEARRQRRNRNARLRDGARRDLGLVKTPYGWE